MANQELTIQGTAFQLPAPYVEGYALKANEAAAINSLFAENIRNNVAEKVREAKAKVLGKEVKNCSKDELISVELPADVTETLQGEITQYANNYEFGIRAAGRSKDPLEREVENIAIQMLENALRAKNLTPSKVKKDNPTAYSAALAQLIDSKRDVLTKEAKKRISEQQKLTNGALEGLDFGALTAKPAPKAEEAAEEAAENVEEAVA